MLEHHFDTLINPSPKFLLQPRAPLFLGPRTRHSGPIGVLDVIQLYGLHCKGGNNEQPNVGQELSDWLEVGPDTSVLGQAAKVPLDPVSES